MRGEPVRAHDSSCTRTRACDLYGMSGVTLNPSAPWTVAKPDRSNATTNTNVEERRHPLQRKHLRSRRNDNGVTSHSGRAFIPHRLIQRMTGRFSVSRGANTPPTPRSLAPTLATISAGASELPSRRCDDGFHSDYCTRMLRIERFSKHPFFKSVAARGSTTLAKLEINFIAGIHSASHRLTLSGCFGQRWISHGLKSDRIVSG